MDSMSEQVSSFCGVCGLEYPTDELADQCQSWCEHHPGEPNPAVARYAIVHEDEDAGVGESAEEAE